MALVKTTIPYEILIRFNWGHLPGKLGDYAGAHFIEAEVIKDDETGEVINIKPGQAQPLDRDKIEAYIGAAILNIDQQIQQMRDALDTATAQRDALVEKSGDLIAEINNLRKTAASIQSGAPEQRSRAS